MVTQAPETGTPLSGQMTREAERTIQRSRQGVDLLLGRNDPPVGLTPKDTLYSRGTLRLYRYRPVVDEVYRVPIIFVMSLISKSYILDLAPNQSFVEYLLRQGFDVYMVDWGVPRPQDHTLRLEDYVLDRLPRCVEEVQRITKEEEHSFLGYCMGGLFALMYGSVFPDAGLKNLVTVATPVDFSGMGLLRRWADPRWFDVDRLVDTYGNVPAEAIRASLEMLRPFDRVVSYARLWDNLWDDTYVYNWRIRYKWAQDQIPFPGECYRQMTKEMMWGNKLVKGEMTLDGRPVNLKQLNCAVLNTMAEYDHIAPYASTRALTSMVGSCDRQDLTVKGGHVSLISGANALLRLWPTVNEWLSARSV
ncbi:MAG: alpha/beta fold hydrolase [Chloroflexi bacterium]|nr:alpha/beta fold hydrolase [Chloroflexota bacterium]